MLKYGFMLQRNSAPYFIEHTCCSMFTKWEHKANWASFGLMLLVVAVCNCWITQRMELAFFIFFSWTWSCLTKTLVVDPFRIASFICSYLLLQIFAGSDDTGTNLTTLCHTQASAQTYTISGNIAYIRFTTDSSVNGRGFNATFQEVIGQGNFI